MSDIFFTSDIFIFSMLFVGSFIIICILMSRESRRFDEKTEQTISQLMQDNHWTREEAIEFLRNWKKI